MSARLPSTRMRVAAATVFTAALLVAPAAARACSVCMGGREDENRVAFLLTTAFLSVLPLAMIGGLGWYLRRRSREIAERREESGRAPALGRTAPSR